MSIGPERLTFSSLLNQPLQMDAHRHKSVHSLLGMASLLQCFTPVPWADAWSSFHRLKAVGVEAGKTASCAVYKTRIALPATGGKPTLSTLHGHSVLRRTNASMFMPGLITNLAPTLSLMHVCFPMLSAPQASRLCALQLKSHPWTSMSPPAIGPS